ncbi:uncharacterized protein [Hyperolius riggenbachi]|uniref:uncharacterized protein n=1 Tax=Hyperolius riggenbachi TaxID=752182 RepID=UPI0035A3B909
MCPFLSHPRDLNNDIRLPVGGRVAHFYENWESHFQNKWLLNIILEGYKIEFATAPPVQFFSYTDPIRSASKLSLTKRNCCPSGKEGNSSGPKMSTVSGVLFSSIPSKKTSGGVQVHLKPKGIKQVNKISKISNGQYTQCGQSATESVLHGFYGPQGRLSPPAYPCQIPAIPEIRHKTTGRGQDFNIIEKRHGFTGSSNFIIPSSSMGSATLQDITTMDFKKLEQEYKRLRQENLNSPVHKGLTELVVDPFTVDERTSLELSLRDSHNNRCKRLGLGSPSGYNTSTGILAQSVGAKIFKQRAGSSLASVDTLRFPNQGHSRHDKNGQQHSGGLSEQTGRNKESFSMVPVMQDTTVGRRTPEILESSPSKGNPELFSRFSEQITTSSGRVVSERSCVSGPGTPLGQTRHGLVCSKEQHKVPDVLLTMPPGQSLLSGRILDNVEFRSDVCLSSSFLNSSSSEQITERPSSDDHDSAILAQKTMVYTTEEFSYSRSCNAARSSRPAVPGSSFSSRSEAPSAFSLEPEWRSLKQKGFSNGLSETLIQSRKKVTRNIYQKTWNVYKGWCEQNSRDCSLSLSVLEFLQEGYQKGLSTSTLKVQTAAISVFLERRLAEEEFFIRFFQALKRIRPLVQSRMPSWDLNTVLQALCNSPFEPLEEISDKCLTIKTAFLVAITSARRVCELQALSMREPYCIISGDRITLRLDTSFLPKVVSKFHRSQEIFLPSFCNNPTNEKEKKLHCLDVRRTVLGYLDRSKQWRKSDALFVLFGGRFKGKQASKSTIARWIRQTIALAYSQQGKLLPSSIKAHSTRAVSASWAEKAGASIEQICRAATWSSQNTFVRHYRLDIAASSDLSFGRKVLQAVVPP